MGDADGSGKSAGRVAYIDTEGSFRPERITEIAEAHGLDPEEILENVVVARAFNHEMQMDLITAVRTVCRSLVLFLSCLLTLLLHTCLFLRAFSIIIHSWVPS